MEKYQLFAQDKTDRTNRITLNPKYPNKATGQYDSANPGYGCQTRQEWEDKKLFS